MIVIETILLCYFIYVVAYTVVFSVAGHFYKKHTIKTPERYRRFAVLIPAYKEDAVILEVARQATLQEYPKEECSVFIIADSFQPETLQALRQYPVTVHEVHFENSTKVKSLNALLGTLPDHAYDFAVILDADNLMEPDFLARMNSLIDTHGFQAIQAQRKPKNENNNLAYLDGISEAINNHIYRQGQVAMGLSSSISGSGVVFAFPVLKKELSRMHSVGGYDRELELRLLQQNISVYYYKDAAVLDEKVSKSATFQNQRKRWISSQYHYLARYFTTGCKALLKGNFLFFNSAVLRNIQLPRLVNLGLLTLVTTLSFFIHPYLFFGGGIWAVLFGLNVTGILLAVPRTYFSWKMVKALAHLPRLFWEMFLLLFRLKHANKKFIHTQHGIATQDR